MPRSEDHYQGYLNFTPEIRPRTKSYMDHMEWSYQDLPGNYKPETLNLTFCFVSSLSFSLLIKSFNFSVSPQRFSCIRVQLYQQNVKQTTSYLESTYRSRISSRYFPPLSIQCIFIFEALPLIIHSKVRNITADSEKYVGLQGRPRRYGTSRVSIQASLPSSLCIK